MKNVNHWGFIVPYKKALYSLCGTTVSLTPDKPVHFFPLLQRINKTYSGLFQSCLFKRVISPSLIQIQIWILPIRSIGFYLLGLSSTAHQLATCLEYI